MNLDAIYARQLVELGYLADIVEEMGYTAQIIEAGGDVPYHTLLVKLEPDGKGRDRQMACTFYPLTEEDSENILLLQYFLELPFEFLTKAKPQVHQLLISLNNKSVLGHFGITDGQNKIHHRYIQSYASSNLLFEQATSEVVSLFNYTSLIFGEAIEAVATQQKTAKEAIQSLQQLPIS